MINQLFFKGELNIEEFTPITVEFLDIPKMFNSVLFKKIAGDENKVTKQQFLK